MVIKLTHSCGWSREIKVLCPKCNKEFSTNSREEAMVAIIMQMVNESEKHEKTKGRLTIVENKLKTK